MTSFSRSLSVVLVVGWIACFVPTGAFLTKMDEPFHFDCPDGEVLNNMESYHDNDREDRVWHFGCTRLPFDDMGLSDCAWTTYVNDWDQPVDYQCPHNGVIAGVAGYHNNRKEDRKWQYRCCYPTNGYATNNCEVTDELNDWDGAMDFTVKEDFVLAGMKSVHDNKREDRRFKAIICQLGELTIG